MRTTLNDHITRIRSSHRQLLAVFGRLREVVLPSKEDVEELICQLFSTLGVEIEEIPFSLESARASLLRTVKKLPPNAEKRQQFKDGVVWEDCLKMLDRETVFFVSDDKDFYENRSFDQGLARELKKDLEGKPNKFGIFPDLSGLLSQIDKKFWIEPALLRRAYEDRYGEKMHNMAAKHCFVLEGEPTAEMDVFVTENPARLYVNFLFQVPCQDATNEGRTDAVIVSRGEGTYDAEGKRFVELATRGEKLIYRLQDGTEKTLENVVMVVGTAVIGHRTVEHSVRHKLQ